MELRRRRGKGCLEGTSEFGVFVVAREVYDALVYLRLGGYESGE